MAKLIILLLVCLASTQASRTESEPKREFDLILNSFGLNGVWNGIQTLDSNIANQFKALLHELLDAGLGKIQHAQDRILNPLVYHLTNQIGDALVVIEQAVNALSNLLHPNYRRPEQCNCCCFNCCNGFF